MIGSIFKTTAVLFVGAFLTALSAQAVTTSYHIGNSLTHDSQPDGIVALAASRGLEHEVGYHILSSASLEQILANPNEVSIEPTEFGTFQQALPNNAWDIVTIQPHPNNSPPVTLSTDTQNILSFINLARSNPANNQTNFYIYQSWPQLTGTPYQTLWNVDSPDSPNTPMTRSREYYQHLIEHVRSETNANVYMVPTGEVLFALDVKIRAGQLPGITSLGQFYRDVTHMSFDRGRFVASAATFATILGQYPNELQKPDGFFGLPTALTPTQTAIIMETIRGVLDTHPYTGIDMPAPLRADFNEDKSVNQLDLDLLLPSIGVDKPFDPDQNGVTNGRDFLHWQRNFKPTPSDEDLASFLISDFNNDGLYNSADLQHWQASYGVNGGADVDGDGDTDSRDLLIWQRHQPSNVNDWNRDYLIDGADLAAWQDSYGYNSAYDANGDGHITMEDLAVWEAENGLTWTFPYALTAPPLVSQVSGLNSLSVPEPATSAVAVVAVVLAMTFSKRDFGSANPWRNNRHPRIH